jgi:type II secretory pathway predicted ATPase ExeA
VTTVDHLDTRKYVKYGLRFNPFPLTPDAAELIHAIDKGGSVQFPLALSINYQVQQALKRFASKIVTENVGLIIGGDWGLGKTHLLLTFVNFIRERHSDNFSIKFVYISPTPIHSREEVYKAIINKLREKYGISVNYTSVREGFQEILKNRLSPKDILIILLDQLEQGVIESLKEVSDWSTIAEIVYSNLDEILRVINSSREYGVALAVAVYNQLLSKFTKYPAVLFHIFQLNPLQGTGDVKDLLMTYLNLGRLTIDELKKYFSSPTELRTLQDKIERNKLYPFTEKAVNALWKYSSGIPRNVLRLAYHALEHVADQGIDFIDDIHVVKAYPDAGNLTTYIQAFEVIWKAPAPTIANVLYKAIHYTIRKAIQKNLLRDLILLPKELDPIRAEIIFRGKLNIKKPYKLSDNCTLMSTKDYKRAILLCVSTRISRPIPAEDIEKYIKMVDDLKLSGLPLTDFILIGLTDLDYEAYEYLSAFHARGINLASKKPRKLSMDSWEYLGKLLCYSAGFLKNHQGRTFRELYEVCSPLLGKFSENENYVIEDIVNNVLELTNVLASLKA